MTETSQTSMDNMLLGEDSLEGELPSSGTAAGGMSANNVLCNAGTEDDNGNVEGLKTVSGGDHLTATISKHLHRWRSSSLSHRSH